MTCSRVLFVALLLSLGGLAQTSAPPENHLYPLPMGGRIAQQNYTNVQLGFSFPIPEGWFINQEMMARPFPSGASLLLILDQHRPDGRLRNRMLLIADDASKYPTLTTRRYVAKLVATPPRKPRSALLKPTVSVRLAGREFFRSDFTDSSDDLVLHKSFVSTRLPQYFLSWFFAVPGDVSELEHAIGLLLTVTFEKPESDKQIPNPEVPGHPLSRPGRPMRVRISEKVSQLLLIKKVQPVYPTEARAKHVEGLVRLKAEISPTGEVTDVVGVSGDELLIPSALEAVKQWKYKAYLLNGQAVAVETQVTLAYHLANQ